MTSYRLFVGLDIAAATFAASWMTPHGRPSHALTLAQTADGWTDLIKRLFAIETDPTHILVVMEATGSYWVGLATTLAAKGIVVSVINPTQAHHFAKAMLKHAKTDAIDAQTLTRLAATLTPLPWTPPPAIYHEIQQRLAHRDTLVDVRQQVRNQLHALLQLPMVSASVKAQLEALDATVSAQIATLEHELGQVLMHDAAWQATAEHLRSIPGIGLLTACWLLVTTLNFSACASATAASAYAGLAPYQQQSGTSLQKKARLRHTGNQRLRTALYMATLSACRLNPSVKQLYDRLRAAGKPMKVARCAAARKLLHIAWAVATKQQRFDPTYGG